MPVFKGSILLVWITFLAIAMAFVESAVVIYLRELYYPNGFSFPMVALPVKIAGTEFLREIATLIMLLAMGFLAGKNARQRVAWFLYSFAIWDIFYYVFLKVILDWPSSWITWDILFLVPVIWTGPVLAPVLVSITMIILSFVILYLDHRNFQLAIRWPVVVFILLGSLLIFVSFIQDFSTFIIRQSSVSALFSADRASSIMQEYIPMAYNWFFLLAGEISIFTGIIVLLIQNRRRNSRHV
jgi:hypothetical protein